MANIRMIGYIPAIQTKLAGAIMPNEWKLHEARNKLSEVI
jgi:hypothetical protein